jgi:hypothetical protein
LAVSDLSEGWKWKTDEPAEGCGPDIFRRRGLAEYPRVDILIWQIENMFEFVKALVGHPVKFGRHESFHEQVKFSDAPPGGAEFQSLAADVGAVVWHSARLLDGSRPAIAFADGID